MGSRRTNNLLGVMQGRLLPKYKGRYQAHPVSYWQDEFFKAAELGLDCIEFIFDYNDYESNPLMTTDGRKEIQSLTDQTGVRVLSVCADYFIEAPLHAENEQTALQNVDVLIKLIKATVELKIKDVVIPCVDGSSIQDENLRDRFTEVLLSIIPGVERHEVNLSLETDLDPFQFEKLLTTLDSPQLTVNYDIGNSAALGYNYKDELSAYGERISDIHIKDRKYGGPSVKLGMGDADMSGFFRGIQQFEYNGPYIMQVYRDGEGVKIFLEQLHWLLEMFDQIL